MRRTRKIAGILAVLAFAGGITTGITRAASADVVPDPTWNEVVPAFTNQVACLDDPGNSTTVGTPIQLFHCHGYGSDGAPQRWTFQVWGNLSPGNTLSRIVSHNLCLGGTEGTVAAPGERVTLRQCSFFGPLWTLHSRNAYSGDPLFTLELGDSSGYCLALPDFSGRNAEPVILEPCDVDAQLQYWTLG